MLPIFPHKTRRDPGPGDSLQAVTGRDPAAARLRTILIFAAAVEFGIGLALMVDPALVVRPLLGAKLDNAGVLVGLSFGIALVALALARWPAGQHGASGVASLRGMLAYNLLLALFLAYPGHGRAARRLVAEAGGRTACGRGAVAGLGMALSVRRVMR